MNKSKIGVIGNGIAGLTASYLLDKDKYDVTVLSKEIDPGGLANSIKINGVSLERYYHHFFTSDKDLLDLVKKLDLEEKVKEYASSVGFYYQKKLIPFSTPIDLLKFYPISLTDRIKMGLLTLYFTKKSKWQDLEKYTCKDFFSSFGADRLYEIIWKPLLRLKFGIYEPEIPATFLWGRINPRGKSRKGLKEKLQYFDGGFETLFVKLQNEVKLQNVTMIADAITSIQLQNNKLIVKGTNDTYEFDKIIYTGNSQALLDIYQDIEPEIATKLRSIQYQAINCMVLELKEQISPYYWLNIVDPAISFAGYIEHTNLVPNKQYGGHVAYVFNYLPSTHPIYNMEPDEVFDLYTKDLKKVFPGFEKNMVKKWHLSRNSFASAIYKGKYSEIVPPMKINNKFFLINTSQVYPEDRNVSNGIALATKLISQFFDSLPSLNNKFTNF